MRNLAIPLVIGAMCSASHADIPQMGGAMSHLLVSIFDQQVFIGFESPSMSTVELLDGSGSFNGAASVLDGLGHNAQFGWLANGFISLPPSSGVFVRTVSMSPYLQIYSEFGYAPILGTEGSDRIWQWDGTMTHNWFASEAQGLSSATFEVFVGDLAGNPLDGWISGTIDLQFLYGADLSGRIGTRSGGAAQGLVPSVPAPAGIALLSLSAVTRRKRASA
ncbi:MAG: hypothetical protein AB8C13_02845 [Phycisphaerales bacterium]